MKANSSVRPLGVVGGDEQGRQGRAEDLSAHRHAARVHLAEPLREDAAAGEASGTSPCSKTQPLSAPRQEMAAKKTTSVAAVGPQKLPTRSAKGAADLPPHRPAAAGTRRSTREVDQADGERADQVARGMVRAGSLTRAAGTAAHSKPSIAHKGQRRRGPNAVRQPAPARSPAGRPGRAQSARSPSRRSAA